MPPWKWIAFQLIKGEHGIANGEISDLVVRLSIEFPFSRSHTNQRGESEGAGNLTTTQNKKGHPFPGGPLDSSY